jgi:hypothetical protein
MCAMCAASERKGGEAVGGTMERVLLVCRSVLGGLEHNLRAGAGPGALSKGTSRGFGEVAKRYISLRRLFLSESEAGFLGATARGLTQCTTVPRSALRPGPHSHPRPRPGPPASLSE